MQDDNNSSPNTPQGIYDITGKTFNSVIVIKVAHKYRGRFFWLIECLKCGTQSVRPAHEFRTEAPPCSKCKEKALYESGLATPLDIQALGFDVTFFHRFWPNVDKNGPIPEHMPHLGNCWLWTKGVTSKGRGSISMRYEDGALLISTHRASWMIHHKQQVPEGKNVLHHCDVPRCCRPEHLFTGSIQDNTDDMIAKGRAFHPKGEAHPNAKLTDAQVIEMRRIRKETGATYKELAEIFHCSPSNAAWIIRCQHRILP